MKRGEFSNKGDSFSTFLETLERLNPSKGEGTQKKRTSLHLIKKLASSGREPLQNLMIHSGMGLIEFADNLKQIQEAGLVALSGTGADQVVELTSTGTMLANMELP